MGRQRRGAPRRRPGRARPRPGRGRRLARGSALISPELAQRLREAGLAWRPAAGDRFVVADRDMDAEVFVVSSLTIDVRDTPSGPLFQFNGTTEWALDSVAQEDVVWLPHEAQLRTALGVAFLRLEPIGDGWAVEARAGGREIREIDVDAECAYARALLAVLAAR